MLGVYFLFLEFYEYILQILLCMLKKAMFLENIVICLQLQYVIQIFVNILQLFKAQAEAKQQGKVPPTKIVIQLTQSLFDVALTTSPVNPVKELMPPTSIKKDEHVKTKHLKESHSNAKD